jgi:hypothetical protein
MIGTIAGLFVVVTLAQTLLVSPPQLMTRLSQALARPITVVGCLRSDQRTFSMMADTNAVPTGTSGTRSSPTGAPPPQNKTIIYTLTPASDVNLKTHIGQIVEITGIEAPSGTAMTTTPAELVARALNVTTVRTVAAECRQAN